MRVVVPQIIWNSKVPVLSVDFDPNCKPGAEGGFYRVATGGADNNLLVWRLRESNTLKPELTCVAELKRHEKTINVVRFSPDGNYIATGGDDHYILLWKYDGESQQTPDSQGVGERENWLFDKCLRKHIGDVSDLSWSPDGAFLLSGSVDNTAALWDVKKGVALHVWSEKEHTGYVNGVAFDPLNEISVTMCLDRTLRVFDVKSKKCTSRALRYPEQWIPSELLDKLKVEEKENLPGEKGEGTDGVPKKKAPGISNRLFRDDSLNSFHRRMSFSPRGELLLVPAGLLPPGAEQCESKIKDDVEVDNTDKKAVSKKKNLSSNNAVVVFCRHSWSNPCAVIPTLDSDSVGCRFCPMYFKQHREPFNYDQGIDNLKKNERTFACVTKIGSPKSNDNSLMKMPYRLVYAIATNNTVMIGDTASAEPLAVIRSIHLARITDVSWSPDGLALIVSSSDAYCSIITFDKGELGEEFVVAPEEFPRLTSHCFPILPPEPEPQPKPKKDKEKASKKKAPKPKEKEEKTTQEKEPKVTVKTPTTEKKAEPSKSRKLAKMFANASKSPVSSKTANSTKCSEEAEKTATDNPTSSTSSEHKGNDKKSEIEEEGGVGVEKDGANEGTPKAKVQKTTLDRWFKTTPKPNGSPVTQKAAGKSIDAPKASSSKSNVADQGKGSVPTEIITLDEDSNSNESSQSSSTLKKIYPMTPPPVKSKAVSRLANSSSSSPLATTPNPSQKRKLGDVTPEGLLKLQTAPIKCPRLEEPEAIMESSPKRNGTNGTSTSSESPSGSASKDFTYPSSPVTSSGSTPRQPRRIALTTLTHSSVPPKEGQLD